MKKRPVILSLLALVALLLPLSPSALAARPVPSPLFAALFELARIESIAYCAGTTGIYYPFVCAGRCSEFQFELVTTWSTGPLATDSSGFIALDHHGNRILTAFRGTYSLANTVVDLAVQPAPYVPWDPDLDPDVNSADDSVSRANRAAGGSGPVFRNSNGPASASASASVTPSKPRCDNCTVHAGFLASWTAARPIVLPALELVRSRHPDYDLVVLGHSLGGAVAALAAVELGLAMRGGGGAAQGGGGGGGGGLTVATFGEPRVGNAAFASFVDRLFGFDLDNPASALDGPFARQQQQQQQQQQSARTLSYYRVTHAYDPIPRLPATSWSYVPHAGEVYISNRDLPPNVQDVWLCDGPADGECVESEGDEKSRDWDRYNADSKNGDRHHSGGDGSSSGGDGDGGHGSAPPQDQTPLAPGSGPRGRRYWMAHGENPGGQPWDPVSAHRDYFLRLGICLNPPQEESGSVRPTKPGKERREGEGEGQG